MRPFFLAALNGLIRNEPCVPAATQISSPTMRPACDVALVLIRNAEREAVDLDLAVDGEMKNIFVAIVQKSFRTDRFKVAERAIADGDRFDPVDSVLKNEQIAQLKDNFVGKHWI